MVTAVLSFLAGLLTAFAPCVLPLLPVILGGSLDPSARDKRRPYIIIASLVASLILFTILLKASTVLIGVNPMVWVYFSGGLVIALGIFMLFPDAWAQVIGRLGIEHRSQKLLGKAYQNKNQTVSAILTGAALGPVFSSCSPTYAWVLATVLPTNAALGVIYLAIYCLGLAIALLAVALLGRRLLENAKWATNPKGWFQRAIAVLFILVGLFIITGWDKKVQTWLVDKDVLNLLQLEEKLIPASNNSSTQSSSSASSDKQHYNVNPYDAPELTGIVDWINTDPLTLQELRGKVVLIDFWTYSCINCQRTQPYLNKWYDRYHDKGFVIIGVHAPEFAFEKVKANVANAVKEEGIKYPVAMDNNFATWRAYENQYWPAKYLIDKDGQVRYTHFGEGAYDETEGIIQDLLKETGQSVNNTITRVDGAQQHVGQTPETYLGYQRGERFANESEFKADVSVNYHLAQQLTPQNWSLGGQWKLSAWQSTATGDGSVMRINFAAQEVYLVMDGPHDRPVTLSLNGKKVTASSNGGADVDSQGRVMLDGPRLYKLVKLPTFQTGQILDITVPKGASVNAFTFGG
ncbi:cytochrome c biogenesis protein DipZ [Candidatus Saccharibacteria bacterium]|nr:cytochrome c biogenesis protein DipZ [Candidatus Saccharibacteria bacterium]